MLLCYCQEPWTGSRVYQPPSLDSQESLQSRQEPGNAMYHGMASVWLTLWRLMQNNSEAGEWFSVVTASYLHSWQKIVSISTGRIAASGSPFPKTGNLIQTVKQHTIHSTWKMVLKRKDYVRMCIACLVFCDAAVRLAAVSQTYCNNTAVNLFVSCWSGTSCC